MTRAALLTCMLISAARADERAGELPAPPQVRAAMDGAVKFLLADQNPNGSWGSQRNGAVGYDEFWSNVETHRSWRVAVTGLVCMALNTIEQTDEVRAAYDRGIDFLAENALVKRPSDWDVDNTWGYLYGLAGLVEAYQLPRYADAPRRAEISRTAEALIDKLYKYQTPEGGWSYYDAFDSVTMPPSWSTSFMTAAMILTLLDARDAGFAVEPQRIDAAVKAVQRCRLPNGAFTYSVNALPTPRNLEWIDQVKGSLGRIQVCNLALLRAGDDVPADRLRQGLDWFFEHHKFLDVARKKPIPHETYYYNSGYFYFFGHYYAAKVIGALPQSDRARYWPRLQREIIKTQEADGSMWDYYMSSYTKPYATAFGLMALSDSLRDSSSALPPPSEHTD